MPETEALLRRLFENMTSGTVICEVANDGSRGSDYIVKAVNAASLKNEGKTESEVVGKSLLELLPRVDEYGVIPVFQQVWKTGDPAAWLPSRQYIENDHVAWYEHHVFRLPGGEIVSIYDDITARKQAEDSLRESEQLYRQVFASTSDAVFLLDVDPDGRISFVNYNPAGERLVGLSSAEVKGRHPEDVYPPAVAEAMNGSYRRMVEEGRPISYDERLHLESGDVWFATTLIPLEDAEGRIVRVLGVAHDITERKQAELLLSRYQLLSTEARDIMLFVRAADGAIVDANAAAEAAYGYSRDELLQLDIYQLCATDSRPMVREQMKATEAGGVLFEAEHRRKDGSLFPVEVSSRGTTFVDGDEVLLSVIRDVSERKRAEEALRHSEERYRSLFEDSPTAMWEEDHSAVKAHLEELIASGVTDVAGYLLAHPLVYERCVGLARTLDVNRAAVKLFGASSRDELLERVDELHPPGVVGGLRLFWAAMLAGERSASFDETNVTLTGRELLLLETCTVAPGHERTFDRVYLVDADVTDRRRAEERLRLTLKAAVAALGATTELRDPYTAGHQRRVAELAGAIAAELGWSEERIETLRIAALLHDIGKIVVPAEILAKPGRLTELEMELVRQHAQAGAATIAHIDFGDAIAATIAQHHERLDGSGYPAGMTGDRILPGARILAVADVVEAMMSHRPYRPAQPTEAALAEIEAGAGRIYDAACCEAVLRLFREQGFTFRDG